MAEFVAQEEMDRLTGYWWAPDDSAVAYARVDEAPVAIEKRFEVYADRAEVIEQRYPAAGKANAAVRLYLRKLGQSTDIEVDLGDERDIYLARVDWLPDASGVLVQRQSRDQRTLDVLLAKAPTATAKRILSETSETGSICTTTCACCRTARASSGRASAAATRTWSCARSMAA